MENLPGYIVILWFIPALLFLGLPLVTLACWLTFQGAKKVHSALTPARVAGSHTSEKRKTQRINVRNIRADISDGIGSCSGLVDNISKMGLCIKNVPESISISNALLSVVIRNADTNYRIVARPRWEQWHPSGVKTIGAEIASYPQNWNDFVTAAA